MVSNKVFSLKKKSKGVQGTLSILIIGAVMLVAAGIAAGVGADVTSSIQDGLTAETTAWAAAGNATLGIGNLAAQMPNIGTVIGAVVIIAIIFLAIGVVGGRGGRGGRVE